MSNSWSRYVNKHLAGRQQQELAEATGVSATAVSRWLNGGSAPKAENVIALARAVGEPPLTALVAAGYITEAEAQMQPAGAPDLNALSDEDLVGQIRERLRRAGEIGGQVPAAKTPPPPPDIAARRGRIAQERPRAARRGELDTPGE